MEADKQLAKIKKEINDFEEEITMLKGDISNLKDIVKIKEDDLEAKSDIEAEQLKLITDLSRENEELKSIITNYEIENRYLKKERGDKDSIITKLNEKLSDHSDKIKDQTKVIQSRTEIIDLKAVKIINLNAKCDKCEYMDERSGIVGNKNNTLIDTNKDVEENNAVANLEMVEKHQGSGKTHLNEPVDLHCKTCSHKIINTSKLKRHQQMFGHSL